MQGFHSREVMCKCGADLTRPNALLAIHDLGGKDQELGNCNLDNCLEVEKNGQPFTFITENVDFRCNGCSEPAEIWSHLVRRA